MKYDYSLLLSSRSKISSVLTSATVGLLMVIIFGIAFKTALIPFIAFILLGLAMIILVAVIGISLVMNYRYRRALAQFAVEGGLQPCDEADMLAALPSCFMVLRNDMAIVDLGVRDGYVLTLANGSPAMIFEFYYTEQKDKQIETYVFTIAAMQEDKVYPHLFLDGKQNGVNAAYQGSQRLSLEGDFDDYFNLYVPADEETAALTIFTPDVMQTLVQGGRPYDVELQGNMVGVIGKGQPYWREILPSLVSFLGSFDSQLREQPADWHSVDVTAALTSDLRLRNRFSVPFVVGYMLVFILVVLFSFWLYG